MWSPVSATLQSEALSFSWSYSVPINPFLHGFCPRKGSLTQADGRFACPAAVSFAGTVLRATPEGEALLAGVDECVTHGWQVQGPDIGVCGRLWLLAVVG